SIPHEVAMENIKTTASKVLPNLRSIWDGQWEDKWWIHPIASPQMPGPLHFQQPAAVNGGQRAPSREPAGAPAGD
ncbi:MAG TPA: hypothetical protein VH916_03475, partial [Dehalococcoidia bacterium]